MDKIVTELNTRTIILLLAIITITILTIGYLNIDESNIYIAIKNNNFEKVTTKQEIPDYIISYVSQLQENNKLSYGIWFFSHSGNKDKVCYILFCGGPKYPNTYDVKIVDHKDTTFEYLNGRPTKKDPRGIVYYSFNFHELEDTSVDYNNDFDYPIVIFKAKKQISITGELAKICINQHGERFSVKNVMVK